MRKKLSIMRISLFPFIVLNHASILVSVLSLAHNPKAQQQRQAPVTTQQRQELVNEILYRRNIFTKSELEIIQKDVSRYLGKMQPETSSSVAHGRRGVALPPNSPTVQVFQHGSLLDWIQRVVVPKPVGGDGGKQVVLRQQDVPVEIRSYDQSGAGMAWHSDDVLFSPWPQLEVVWTLENTSDCQTLYKKTPRNQITESIQTEVNSVLLVPAGGPEHCVTSLQRGRRIIIKAVYALEGCQYMQEAQVQQFKGPKSRKGKRRR